MQTSYKGMITYKKIPKQWQIALELLFWTGFIFNSSHLNMFYLTTCTATKLTFFKLFDLWTPNTRSKNNNFILRTCECDPWENLQKLTACNARKNPGNRDFGWWLPLSVRWSCFVPRTAPCYKTIAHFSTSITAVCGVASGRQGFFMGSEKHSFAKGGQNLWVTFPGLQNDVII